ncbi:MAG: hypothetical protein HY920_08940, partial [Elusimicrobia bacterium]|nr:hypothetical protein [Elusimicrobiota bacterium]
MENKEIQKRSVFYKNKMSLYILFLVLLFPINLFATNEMATIFRTKSSKMFFGSFSNYDFYNRDILFEFQHEVEFLDMVRDDLVKQHKIMDIPIVISIPSGLRNNPVHNSVSLEETYDLGADASGYCVPLNTCYLINLVSVTSFENIVTALLLLEKIGSHKLSIEIKSLEYEKKAFAEEISAYSKIRVEFPFELDQDKFALKGLW